MVGPLRVTARPFACCCRGVGFRRGNAGMVGPLRVTARPFASRGGIASRTIGSIQKRQQFQTGSIVPLQPAVHAVQIRRRRATPHLRLHHALRQQLPLPARAEQQGHQPSHDSYLIDSHHFPYIISGAFSPETKPLNHLLSATFESATAAGRGSQRMPSWL